MNLTLVVFIIVDNGNFNLWWNPFWFRFDPIYGSIEWIWQSIL